MAGIEFEVRIESRGVIYKTVNAFRRFIKREQKRTKGELLSELHRILDKEAAKIVAQFKLEVKDWQHKPAFEVEKIINLSGDGEASVDVFPVEGVEGSVDIWRWVSKGTDYRWAVMSNDWVSKTDPNRIGSTLGKGYVRLKGKKAMNRMGYTAPKPGIEARDFEGRARDNFQDDFYKNVGKALDRLINS